MKSAVVLLLILGCVAWGVSPSLASSEGDVLLTDGDNAEQGELVDGQALLQEDEEEEDTGEAEDEAEDEADDEADDSKDDDDDDDDDDDKKKRSLRIRPKRLAKKNGGRLPSLSYPDTKKMSLEDIKRVYGELVKKAINMKRKLNWARIKARRARNKRQLARAITYKAMARVELRKFKRAVEAVRVLKKRYIELLNKRKGIEKSNKERDAEILQKKINVTPAISAAARKASRPVFRAFMRWFTQTYANKADKPDPTKDGTGDCFGLPCKA